jgi:ABC-type dipeptide/oligopeptide/nickel transport system permease subunit
MTAPAAAQLAEKGASGRADLLREFLRTPSALLPLAVLTAIALAAVFAPLIAPYEPTAIAPTLRLLGPSSEHWLGTDELGRDMLSRLLYGGRLALGIAAASTAIALIVGVIWGALAAMAGGLIDEVLMRIADAAMAIPFLLLALVFVAAFGASLTSLIVVLGLLHAPWTARIARVAFLTERQADYTLAAVAYGASTWRLIVSEILPNVVPTLMVQASVVAASVLLTEAALSFVGLGVQPPQASWGTLLLQGYALIYSSYWYIIFPGLAIFITIWCLNALADHLQAVLDPRGAASVQAATP